MPQRSLPAEKNAISVFQRQRGALPSNSEDWAAVHRIAYPTLNDLPDEFKGTEKESFYSAGINKPTAPQAGAIPNISGPNDRAYLQSQIDQTNQAKTQSNEAFSAYDNMPSGNEALRVLQEAIKAKANPKDFSQAPIGESEIFKQAGVGGYGALASSLSARGKEFDANRADFANTVSQMADVYKTQAETTQRRYAKSVDDYQFLSEQLNKTLEQMRQDEQQIKIVKLQNDLQKELKEMDYAHDDANRTPSIEEVNGVSSQWDPKTKTWISIQTPDPESADANALADAIALHESGGRFDAKGGSGEHGAFQFMPGTWVAISKAYAQANGINQSIPMTKDNEDKVARWKIKSLLDSGRTPREVALIWNGSLGGSEQAVVKSGTNSAGIKYDTGAYADAVLRNLKKSSAGVSVDSKAKQTAMDIFSGTSNQKLTDVPTKDRPAVAAELTKLKEAAMSSGDVEGAIRASAGGTNPSDAFKQSFEKGINVVNQIADLKKSIADQATGPILGIVRSNNPYDTKAQKIKAQLTAIVPNLARGVYGEVGVLTDQDVELYARTLPNLKSTEEVNKALLGIAIRSVQRSLETKIEVQAGSGTDVSGLLNVYQKVKKQADNLMGPEASAAPSVTASGLDLSKFER